MTFVILNWSDMDFINTVCKDDGSGETMLFDTKKEAEDYAKEQLNFDWKVVSL